MALPTLPGPTPTPTPMPTSPTPVTKFSDYVYAYKDAVDQLNPTDTQTNADISAMLDAMAKVFVDAEV